MTVALTVLGAACVLVALRDVFDTLFHPHGRAIVSRTLIRVVWRIARRVARRDHRLLSVAGPVAFLIVIGAWGTLVLVGFAFMILPQLPEGFSFDPGLDPAAQDGFEDALYVSMVNLVSLGTGDIVPTLDGFRLLSPLETLIGLGLLTASISWILFLYQVLSHYRSLSHEIQLLSEAEDQTEVALPDVEPAAAAEVLGDLTSRVLAMRDDFVHSPIAYYFHPRDERHALPALLPGLLDLVERCEAPERAPALRLQAAMLRQAITDLLATIATEFLHADGSDPREALSAYQRDHRWD